MVLGGAKKKKKKKRVGRAACGAHFWPEASLSCCLCLCLASPTVSIRSANGAPRQFSATLMRAQKRVCVCVGQAERETDKHNEP